MKKNNKQILNQKGQLSFEAVLIVILLLIISTFATRYIRDNKFLARMLSGPWSRMAGMMETGNWDPPAKAWDETKHPHVNTMTRTGD